MFQGSPCSRARFPGRTLSRSAAFSAVASLVVLLAGCGGSSPATSPAPTIARQPTQRKQSRPASQHSRNTHTRSTAHDTHEPGAPPRQVRRRIFESRAGTICQRTHFSQPPSSPSRPTPDGRQSPVPVSPAHNLPQTASLRRTINTLLRLRPPPSLRPDVARLLRDMQRLQQLNAAFSSHPGGADTRRDALRAVSAAEQRTTQDAIAAGLPGCTMTPLGHRLGNGRNKPHTKDNATRMKDHKP